MVGWRRLQGPKGSSAGGTGGIRAVSAAVEENAVKEEAVAGVKIGVEDAKGSSGKDAGKGSDCLLVLRRSKSPNASKEADTALEGGGEGDGVDDWLHAVEYSKIIRAGAVSAYAGIPTR